MKNGHRQHDHGTAHDHDQDHDQDHAHAHAQDPGADDAAVADLLDLDAEVLGDHLAAVIGWVASRSPAGPRTVADVGAGTGSGTLALARRFSAARLIAVDRSPVMLDRLTAVAAVAGLVGRLRVVLADLDTAWPSGADGIDLAWAASSLHHLREPGRLLGELHAAIVPGGLLAVVEMDGLPRFLPDDLGIGRPGLEQRCRDLVKEFGWNSYPNWSGPLEHAGFADVEEQTFDYDVRPAPEAARRYALRVLGGMRRRLADRLAQDDLDTLDQLLAQDGGPASVLVRDDLVVRGSRTVWAARRP